MPALLSRIIGAIIDKKKIIGWIAAVIIGIVALVMGMNSAELKDAICAAPVVNIPAPAPVAAPAVAVPAPAPDVKK